MHTVVSTLTGKTALDISSLRPNSFIIATVTDPKVARSLALKWGVYPKLVPFFDNTDDIVNEGAEIIVVGGAICNAKDRAATSKEMKSHLK